MLVAYHRGRMAPDAGITGGLMAAAGLSAADAAARIQKEGCTDVVVGCDNSPVGVTLSGRVGSSDDIRFSRNLCRSIASHRMIFGALGIAAPWDALCKNKHHVSTNHLTKLQAPYTALAVLLLSKRLRADAAWRAQAPQTSCHPWLPSWRRTACSPARWTLWASPTTPLRSSPSPQSSARVGILGHSPSSPALQGSQAFLDLGRSHALLWWHSPFPRIPRPV